MTLFSFLLNLSTLYLNDLVNLVDVLPGLLVLLPLAAGPLVQLLGGVLVITVLLGKAHS